MSAVQAAPASARESAAAAPRAPASAWRADALAVAGLIALVAALYGDLLLPGTETVVSHGAGDIFRYFLPVRAFGYEELARGNIPYWNPYLFSGTPFVGAWQSAMFYPLNLLHLVLPLHLALNVEAALHVLLMALFTCFWARQRGIRPAGAFFAGVVAICSGAYVERVLAGQLTVLAALAWVPLFYCALEKVLDRPSFGWILVGILALAMQVLAGHPGYNLMAGFVAVFYALIRLGEASLRRLPTTAVRRGGFDLRFGWRRFADFRNTFLALATIGIGAVLISAVQLWTGLDVAGESLRGSGVDYRWASTYSLPPENLLTIFVPALFGDVLTVPYWGRTFFWDANLFFGVVTVVLAFLGATAPGRSEARRGLVALILVMLVLSLGRHTWVHRLLFDWVPGFAQLRAPSKFSSFAVLAVALLAGIGVDRLLGAASGVRRAAGWLLVLGVVLLLGGAWVDAMAAGTDWQDLVRYVQEEHEVYYWLSDPDVARAAPLARSGLLVAGGIAVLAAGLLVMAQRRRWAAVLVVAIAVVDLFAFARTYRGEFRAEDLERPVADRLFRNGDPKRRTFDLGGQRDRSRNRAMAFRRSVIWGYDPIVLGRYAEFIRFTQKLKAPLWYMTNMTPRKPHPLMRLVRADTVILPAEGDPVPLPAKKAAFRVWGHDQNSEAEGPDSLLPLEAEPLPRFLFVSDFVALPDREHVLPFMGQPGLDLARFAVLDRLPLGVHPHGGKVRGEIRVLSESSDEIVLDVTVDAEGLLVLTDIFSEGWRAVPIDAADERRYEVLPVDHILRGIPLRPGHHRFRLEYAPASVRIGPWVSLGGGVLYLLAVLVWAGRGLALRRRGRGTLGGTGAELAPGEQSAPSAVA